METRKLKKVNVGTSSYGMKNVIMTYVETEEHKCSESDEKNHKCNECRDCYNIDYWSCSGCCYDDETISFYGKSYGLKCHCCGAGVPQQY